ncbi:hypothetical protein [Kaistella solincola]|uniref:hypothetical protein n=1 Tax=Kaistella solincola TaxID=510955 RepID=UPI0006916AEF|nr:hypothetical protein [Kaistella solincola]
MFYFFVFLAIALSVALFFSVIRDGRFRTWAKAYRIVISAVTAGVFVFLFFQKSTYQFRENSVTLQLINKLPFPLDFYLIKINNTADEDAKYETKHIGKIRDNFYRIDYLMMQDSNEYWIAGYMGAKKLVYFSQHMVPNKNEDQIIEVQNYIIQSAKFADTAQFKIEELKLDNIKTAIWITLDLLLLFLNLALLVRKQKQKIPTVLAGIS